MVHGEFMLKYLLLHTIPEYRLLPVQSTKAILHTLLNGKYSSLCVGGLCVKHKILPPPTFQDLHSVSKPCLKLEAEHAILLTEPFCMAYCSARWANFHLKFLVGQVPDFPYYLWPSRVCSQLVMFAILSSLSRNLQYEQILKTRAQ